MKTLAVSLTVLLVLSLSTPALALDHNPNCPLKQLNAATQAHLALSPGQLAKVQELNRKYWHSRMDIQNDPTQIGKNTAVLACWVAWKEQLAAVVTAEQMDHFLAWQSEVDLLGTSPY